MPVKYTNTIMSLQFVPLKKKKKLNENHINLNAAVGVCVFLNAWRLQNLIKATPTTKLDFQMSSLYERLNAVCNTLTT